MLRTTLVAVAFAALLVTAGTVAAAPGNAPVDVGADDQYDDHAEDAEDGNADDAANDSADGQPADAPVSDGADGAADSADSADESAADTDRRGPPADLPGPVPDHVAEIHDAIGSFLTGDLGGSLGDAVSGSTPADAGQRGAGA